MIAPRLPMVPNTPMNCFRPCLLAGLASLIATASATSQTSQTVVQRVLGVQFNEELGTTIRPVGDLDQDGTRDYLIGAPRFPSSFGEVGRVVAISAATGQQLYSVVGVEAGARFGAAISGIDDISGDGVPDFAVGSPWSDANGTNSGRVDVYSGADGSRIATRIGPIAGAVFGFALDSTTFGGRPLFLVGAPSDRTSVDSSVRLYDAPRDALFGTVTSPSHHRLGSAIAVRGTIAAVGAPGSGPRGEGSVAIVQLASSAGLVETGRYLSFGPGNAMGTSVALTVNPNGAAFLCGGPGTPTTPGSVHSIFVAGNNVGLVEIYFGTRDGDGFGTSVSAVHDANGDGVEDFVIGAPTDNSLGANTGKVYFYDGLTRQLRYQAFGSAGRRFGQSVALVPDISGDGLADILVGSPNATVSGRTNAGVLEVASVDLEGQLRRFGASCSSGFLGSNRNGLFLGGRVRVEATSVQPGGALGYWLIGLGRLGISLDPIGMTGCELATSPITATPVTVSGTGRATIDIPIPADANLLLQEFNVQFVHTAPGANPLGLQATAGLALQIGNR